MKNAGDLKNAISPTSRHVRSLASFLALLKANDLKLTTPRKAIIQALLEKHGPFTAEEIHNNIPKRICDLATIYRNISSLEKAKIIQRCEFGDGIGRYEIAEHDHHHHHLICNVCRRIEVIDECEIDNIDFIPKKRGFTEISHRLEFFGICPNCR